MTHYIEKSALVEEIERIKKEECPIDSYEGRIKLFYFERLLSFINDLEVKEVDLESSSFDATICKNSNTYLKKMDKDAIIKALEPYKDGDKVKVIIKSQEGE